MVLATIDPMPVPPSAVVNLRSERPVPGEPFYYGACVISYSFELEDGRNIAVIPAHCGNAGDLVWASTAKEGGFDDTADPIGEVIYSDTESNDSALFDVGFVELNESALDARWVVVDDNVPHVVADKLEEASGEVCLFGPRIGESCGELDSDRMLNRIQERNDDGEVEAEFKVWAMSAWTCSIAGDSGSPVVGDVDGTKAIIGMVSSSGSTYGREESDCGGNPDAGNITMFTSVAEIQRIARKELSQPLGEYPEQ